MHGSPLLRGLLVTLVLLLAGIPLWRLTHARAETGAPAPGAAAAPAVASSTVRLGVAFAQTPLSFAVLYLGKPLWQVDAVSSPAMEKTVSMSYPKEGVDLEYRVKWPPGTALSAARLAVAPGDSEPVEKTLWGSGQVDDVLTFP